MDDLRLPEAGVLAQRIRDVLPDRQRIEQRGPLEHVAHPPPEREQLLLFEVLDMAPEDPEPAAVGTDQARHQAEQHCLAGTAAAHDDEGLALGQRE